MLKYAISGIMSNVLFNNIYHSQQTDWLWGNITFEICNCDCVYRVPQNLARYLRSINNIRHCFSASILVCSWAHWKGAAKVRKCERVET